jgi:hypothetical protein
VIDDDRHRQFTLQSQLFQQFLPLDDARETIAKSWRIDYNQVRPHSTLAHWAT